MKNREILQIKDENKNSNISLFTTTEAFLR
jgi:hypothetical protein